MRQGERLAQLDWSDRLALRRLASKLGRSGVCSAAASRHLPPTTTKIAMCDVLVWSFDAITGINWLEVIKALASVVTAVIAFLIKPTWSSSSPAQEITSICPDFLVELRDSNRWPSRAVRDLELFLCSLVNAQPVRGPRLLDRDQRPRLMSLRLLCRSWESPRYARIEPAPCPPGRCNGRPRGRIRNRPSSIVCLPSPPNWAARRFSKWDPA